MAMIFLSSCHDACDGVKCVNGDCVDGSCQCSFGYSGDSCTVKRINSFKGFWEGKMDCSYSSDTVVLKVETVDNSLTNLKMHTVGFIFSNLITLNFDQYVMTAKADSTFKKFVIDTLPITYTIPTLNQDINLKVTGTGTLKDDNNMEFNIFIKTDFQFIPQVTCSGTLTK